MGVGVSGVSGLGVADLHTKHSKSRPITSSAQIDRLAARIRSKR